MKDDVISRQAAIEAFLTELTKRERKNLLHTWSTVEVKYFITDMMEQLPSAQLEPCEDALGVNLHVVKISKHCSDFSDLDKVKECEDAVSRQAAIKCCTFGRTSLGLIDELRRLPSVTPKAEQPEPCEDVVSREAVLDMLHQECSPIVENFMKEKINAMPSVTAKEHPEIIHCRECKHLIDHRCRKIRTLDDWRKPDDFCSYAERWEEGGE